MIRCSIAMCGRPAGTRGWCTLHYNRWLRHGDPEKTTKAEIGAGHITPRGYRMLCIDGMRRTEHIFIAERALGRRLPPKALVHHVNGNGLDNRPENLVICPDAAYHALIHMRERAMDACGNPNWRKCSFCKQYDAPENLNIRKDGSVNHKSCVNAYYRGRPQRKKKRNATAAVPLDSTVPAA